MFLGLPAHLCGFCGSEAARCISLWYWVRSGEDGRIEGLGGSREVGGMSLGEKVVAVIKTEC